MTSSPVSPSLRSPIRLGALNRKNRVDLVEYFKHGVRLNQAAAATFYQGGEHGYLDYPRLAA